MVIEKIVGYLDEDFAALESEMRTGSPTPHKSFLDAAGRAEIGVRLYQEHVRALASVLWLTSVDRELDRSSGRWPRAFQDHVWISLRILKGRSMARPAAQVASVMSRRPVSRCAPIPRFRRAAMTRGPDRVCTVESSSR
jgi:hypothetical protein